MTIHDDWEVQVARGRHVRLTCYALVSLSITLVAHYHLGFDRPRALAYAIAAYALLVVLNFRNVLSKVEPSFPTGIGK